MVKYKTFKDLEVGDKIYGYNYKTETSNEYVVTQIKWSDIYMRPVESELFEYMLTFKPFNILPVTECRGQVRELPDDMFYSNEHAMVNDIEKNRTVMENPIYREEILTEYKEYVVEKLNTEDKPAYIGLDQNLFPLFTRENAKPFGASDTGTYWWPLGIWNTGRMDFLNWLIEQYQNDETDIRHDVKMDNIAHYTTLSRTGYGRPDMFIAGFKPGIVDSINKLEQECVTWNENDLASMAGITVEQARMIIRNFNL
jgi:hypothetical protein